MFPEKKKWLQFIVLLLGMMSYSVALFIENSMWSDVFSPVLALLCAGFILVPLRKGTSYFGGRLMLGLMAISWALAESIWSTVEMLMGIDAQNNALLLWLYAIPNLLLAGACFTYLYKNIKKWHLMQLVINIVAAIIVIFGIAWIFISGQFGNELLSKTELLATYVYLILDSVAITIICTLYFLSKGSYKIPIDRLLVIAGIFTFVITDLTYIYHLLNQIQFATEAMDVFYMLSLVLFAGASILHDRQAKAPVEPESTVSYESQNNSLSLMYLTILPVAAWALELVDTPQFLHLLIVIVIAQVISGYVQAAIRNDLMLGKEIEMKLTLEREVIARTVELQEKNAILTELSTIDALTGLFNRRYFIEQLDAAISDRGTPLAILFMDLDRFKAINDSHGHEMGDRVLQVISNRLKAWAPDDVILSRLGGDEFVVLVTEDIEESRLKALCEDIVALCNQPIDQSPYVLHLGVSIGISQYPKDAQERDLLMKYADIAMYHVKKDYYSDRYVFFSEWLSEKIVRHHQLELMLRDVNFDESFELHYQPLYGLEDQAVIGAEALLRWKTPEGHYISPMEFIPIAEEIGLIIDIGKWVMHRAFHQAAVWNALLEQPIKIGINLSPKQLDAADFLDSLNHAMVQYGAQSAWIDLEITESCAMNMDLRMDEILSTLEQMGISVSLDDFGTGYSSLSYIKQFEISRLKIAKELVDHIETDPAALMIVKAIIMMAKGMALRTIAEGVESEGQMLLLKDIGCDEIQGYWYGKPVPVETFENHFLKSRIQKEGGVS